METVIYKKWDERYEVGSDGSVWSLSYNWSGERKELKQRETQYGYRGLTLRINGKRKSVFVHRMIAEAFIPNPNKLPIINHKNGIRYDNRPENLEWCTVQYNVIDGWKRGRTLSDKFMNVRKEAIKGNKNPKAFVTADMVEEVLKLRSNGMKIREIEKIIGIKRSHISNICRGEHYLIKEGAIDVTI